MYEYFDGESEKPLVRMSWNVAKRCSRPGGMDDQAAKDIHNVDFVANDEDVKSFLSGYGLVSGNEELDNPEENKKTLLWIAACDVAENPDDYDVRNMK